jgi:hypothetical protein
VRTTTLIATALPLAALLAACGRAPRADAASDVDLQRDLRLAATTTIRLATPPVDPANFKDLETAPPAARHTVRHPVKTPGPAAIASQAPDLAASRTPQTAAAKPVPQMPAVAAASAPDPYQDPVATLPRPGAFVLPAGNGAGTAPRGGTGAGGIGPIIGVIIRGGDIDGDHCEPHGGRGRGPLPGVYIPEPGGVAGGSRFPVIPTAGGGIRR